MTVEVSGGNRKTVLFLLGVLDVIGVGLAAGEELFDVLGTSKPNWNSVVDVLKLLKLRFSKSPTFGVTSRMSSLPVVAIPPAFSKMKAIGAASYRYRS